jgi:hypothetical protein
VLCAVVPFTSFSATRYVSPLGSHTAPYLSWQTAATNIQSAINAAAPSDVVLVTNGVYGTGGLPAVLGNAQTNRVVINRPVIVRSVNGPEVTIIEGAWTPGATNGPMSVRGVYMTSGATLDGFTVTKGSTIGPAENGGGLLCSGTSVVTNCVVRGNATRGSGGGVYGGTVRNSRIENNIAIGMGGGSSTSVLIGCIVQSNYSDLGGGGAYAFSQSDPFTNCAFVRNRARQIGGGIHFGSSGTARNCTIVQNSAASAGGVAGGTLINCIVYHNSAPGTANYGSTSFSSSCTTPLPNGPSNISKDPKLLPDFIHLDSDSPCIGRGLPPAAGRDIDGLAWNSPPSIGCDEWNPDLIAVIKSPRAIPAKSAGDVVLSFSLAGGPAFCQWSKDGVMLTDGERYEDADSANLLIKHFGPSDAGSYQAVATNGYGAVTSAVVQLSVACVDLRSSEPSTPYASWETAANNIQDAVDAAQGATVVLVTNGIYAEGERLVAGHGATRVVLDKPVTVVSVHGAAQTIIQGAWDPISTNGPASVRCVWLGADAFLGGFTLNNGSATGNGGGILMTQQCFEAQVYGCVITNCSAAAEGGGVYGAWLEDCVLANNAAASGGAIAAGVAERSAIIANSAPRGAGAYRSTLEHCRIIGNLGTGVHGGEAKRSLIATNSGDGITAGEAENCRIIGNAGSGAVSSLVRGSLLKANLLYGSNNSTNLHCTITANAMAVNSGRSTNSLFAFNAQVGTTGWASHCILQPDMAPGAGMGVNWYLFPKLQTDLEHIAASSACVGRGTNLGLVEFDIDGEPYNNPPAIGCDEWSPNIRISAQPRVVPEICQEKLSCCLISPVSQRNVVGQRKAC